MEGLRKSWNGRRLVLWCDSIDGYSAQEGTTHPSVSGGTSDVEQTTGRQSGWAVFVLVRNIHFRPFFYPGDFPN